MKKILLATVTAAAICLGGCASTGGVGTISAADITTFEDNIIADAIAGCKFEPSLASIGSLIANVVVPGSSALTAVAAGLANSICSQAVAAATPATPATGMRKVAGPIIVNGTIITGHFVQ